MVMGWHESPFSRRVGVKYLPFGKTLFHFFATFKPFSNRNWKHRFHDLFAWPSIVPMVGGRSFFHKPFLRRYDDRWVIQNGFVSLVCFLRGIKTRNFSHHAAPQNSLNRSLPYVGNSIMCCRKCHYFSLLKHRFDIVPKCPLNVVLNSTTICEKVESCNTDRLFFY